MNCMLLKCLVQFWQGDDDMNKRLLVGLISGAVLGVFCIIGANLRFQGDLSTTYLFSFWFNRLIMGLVIGLLPVWDNPIKFSVRGLLIGLLISFAFYSATDYLDLMGFFAGGVYGIIIEWTTKKIS